VVSHLAFVTARVALTSGVFLLVMAPFGVFSSVLGVVLAFFLQLLIGLAFATPVYAITASVKDESVFALLFRLGMIPMFLFSGAFFPVGNLDPFLRVVARLTPLWQGVDLTRMLTVGDVRGGLALVHVGYLVALTVAGYLVVLRKLERRLVE
jgi:lipooligosaccharide transport system permease protein